MKSVKKAFRMLALAVMVCVLLSTAVFATENGSVWLSLDETSTNGGTAALIVTNTTVTDGLVKLTYDSSALSYVDVTVDEAYVAMYSVNATEEGAVLISWVAPENYETDGSGIVLIRVNFTGSADAEDFTLTGKVSGGDGNEVAIGAVDTAALKQAIADAEAVDAALYTEDSYGAVAAALEEAKAVLADPAASQTELDAAAAALKAALETLELKPVDTAALEALVESAKAVNAEDYTEATYAAVEVALDDAEAVLANADATQAEVDAAAAALKAALDALAPAETEPATEPTEPATEPTEPATEPTEPATEPTEPATEPTEPATEPTEPATEATEPATEATEPETEATEPEIEATEPETEVTEPADKPVAPDTNPPTSDVFPLLMLTVLVMGSFAALVVLAVKGKKWAAHTLSVVLVLAMILTMAPVTGIINAVSADEYLSFEELTGSGLGVNLTNKDNVTDLEVNKPVIDEDAAVKVIIVMEGQAVAQKDPDAVLNATTRNQIKKLEASQNKIVSRIEKKVMDGQKLEISYQYTWLLNGVATTVPYGMIDEIKAVDGVSHVYFQPVYEVCKTTDSVAAPNTVSDGVMIGRENAWATGYTGKGMKIAIIDTGLDTDHQNFAALGEEKLTDSSANADTVAAVLENLNASARYEGLTAEDVYYSTKVVYGFNYCDDNLNISHDAPEDFAGDHGTHVAGIAAANKVDGSEVVGVAPDAQLYVMKVFGENGGAYAQDILAALEDALMLGADVVNMSLGSPAGFTSGDYTEEGDLLDVVYEGVAQTGTVLAVSAGNNYNSGYANSWGTDANLTLYPDNGVVGSPGSYANTMTVASVENLMVQRNYINADGYKFTYIDTGDSYYLPALTTLTGAYELVVVPGSGAVEDYEGLDVAGKIALVQRGSITFLEKHANAEAAGAVGCLVYNNTTGEFGMDMTDSYATTPCAAITMADGEYLVAALAENPGLTLTFPTDLAPFPNELAYTMSDFSSVGPAPDLSLAPDITAPGGYIYSTINDGQYGVMSGTSMAAPNIAGMSAVVMQYVKENFPAGTDYRALVQDLLASTAAPLVYDGDTGLAYSPRSQGSGLANAYNAITTQAYLTVDGSEIAKAELGEDADRTGVYDYSFNVHNFGDSAVYYALATSVQTEDVLDLGLYFMAGTPLALSGSAVETTDNLVLKHDVDNDSDTDSHDAYHIYRAAMGLTEGWQNESFRYDLDADEAVAAADVQTYLDALVGNGTDADLEATVLKVAAGETAVVSVNVTLSDDDKAFFQTYYPNGGYVEGFTVLTALNAGGVDLSLPYLAFYGDWADAPVLDNGSYWDYYAEGFDEQTMVVGNQYVHALFTQFGGEDYGAYPGMNVYVEEPFDMDHIALSPNGDGFMDTLTDIYLSLMRNASSLTLRYTDMETGEVYHELSGTNIPKSVYYAAYGQVVPFVYTMYVADPMYDWAGLENNTKVLFEAEVVGVDAGDEPETWSVPITVDLEAPELLSAKRVEDPDTGAVTLELTFRDNHAASAILLVDSTGTYALAVEGVEDVEPDENGYQNYTKTYDITGLDGKLMIILSDYAVNESYYAINLGGEGASYGDLVAFQYNFDSGINGWVSFDTDVAYDETTIFMSDEAFVAAEYVNGYVFAQTESGALYGFRYLDMLSNTMDLESTYIAQLDNVYQDFAYSYAEGKLYGLFSYADSDGYPTSEVYSINLKGEYYDPDMWMTVMPYQEDWVLGRGGLYGLALAVDDAGTVYVLGPNYDWDTEDTTETAHLWSVGMEYDEWSDSYMLGYALSELGDTGLSMDYLQSMTWDHNSEKLYWARFDGDLLHTESELYEIDPANVTYDEETGLSMVSCTKLGDLSGETCALFAPLTAENAAKDAHANVPAMDTSVVGTPVLRESAVTMNVGSSKQLGYDIDPWYSDFKEVVWSTSDETVVTVDGSGNVTAVGTGSAEITVANAADETVFDICTVEVTALDLKLEGIISSQGSGLGSVYDPRTFTFEMVDGIPTITDGNYITASDELYFGLSLGAAAFGRGSIWATEFGNAGTIYEIDADTGAVKDVLMPVGGDTMYGLAYSEATDTFTGIMNMNLYVDMPMTHDQEQEVIDSYDRETNRFTWHHIDMLPYLEAANGGFVTGENGQGAMSEIVMSGITIIEGGVMDAYGDTYYYDTYKDYLGDWAFGGMCSYQPTQTLVILDNVGRLWYINEVTGMTLESDEWGNMTYMNEYGDCIDGGRNGVFAYEYVAEDGTATYSVFHITQIIETPLTAMFREGTMPRITYHFSDLEFAGYTAEGDPMYIMSLYDYWNDGITNELYLFVPGHETDEMDYETWEYIRTPDRLFSLGTTGAHNIIATIYSAEVTGGVDPEESIGDGGESVTFARGLLIGAYAK